jgi:hypothetical protein
LRGQPAAVGEQREWREGTPGVDGHGVLANLWPLRQGKDVAHLNILTGEQLRRGGITRSVSHNPGVLCGVRLQGQDGDAGTVMLDTRGSTIQYSDAHYYCFGGLASRTTAPCWSL